MLRPVAQEKPEGTPYIFHIKRDTTAPVSAAVSLTTAEHEEGTSPLERGTDDDSSPSVVSQ